VIQSSIIAWWHCGNRS